MKKIKELFRSEVAKKKVLLGITNKDIAKMTGIPYSMIRKFMSGKYVGNNDRIAATIAESLNIKE